MMGQAGHLTMEQTQRSMTLFSQDIYPRLKELTASYDADQMKETRAALPQKDLADLGNFGVEFVR